MRLAPLVAIVGALLLPAGAAIADEPCGFQQGRVEPVPGARVYVETEGRDCPGGRSSMVGVGEAGFGRFTLEWYDDERGRGVEAYQPPYFFRWAETEHGCVMLVFVLGLGEVPFDCVAGSPPTLP